MGHPARMKAISAGKKKSDSIDARPSRICSVATCYRPVTCCLQRCAISDGCLRYRNLVVQQSVRMQNKMAGLLMESGTAFRQRTEPVWEKMFFQPDESSEKGTKCIKNCAQNGSQSFRWRCSSRRRSKSSRMLADQALQQRVERLMSIRGVGGYHRVDLGVGGSRPTSPPLYRGCGQLLWLNGCLPILGRQTATRAHLQTTQRLATDGVDRSSQISPAIESSTGSIPRQATGARPCQSGYACKWPGSWLLICWLWTRTVNPSRL